MKKILFVLLFAVPTVLLAQKRTFRAEKKVAEVKLLEVYKWEAYTAKGVLVFGVSRTKETAEKIIKDFAKRNWNTSAKPLYDHIESTTTENEAYFETFAALCPKGYVILSTAEMAALNVFERDGIKNAAVYFDKLSTDKTYLESMEHVAKLFNDFKPYRIL